MTLRFLPGTLALPRLVSEIGRLRSCAHECPRGFSSPCGSHALRDGLPTTARSSLSPVSPSTNLPKMRERRGFLATNALSPDRPGLPAHFASRHSIHSPCALRSLPTAGRPHRGHPALRGCTPPGPLSAFIYTALHTAHACTAESALALHRRLGLPRPRGSSAVCVCSLHMARRISRPAGCCVTAYTHTMHALSLKGRSGRTVGRIRLGSKHQTVATSLRNTSKSTLSLQMD